VSWLIRGVFNHTITARGGTLLIPIVLYVCFVFVGLINGLATGGKFNIALFEVRAQVYFLLAYLMAVNMSGEEHRRISTLFWISAIAIGLKGILASFRFVFTLKGVTIPEIGIGAHEESFFFNCFVFELIVLKLADVEPKLRRLMIIMLPFVVLANLANERRAATAAMVLAMLIMFVLAAVAFPKRRKAIAITTIIIAAVAAVYLPLYWNKTGTLAQPARAIKSQFSPDERDQSSNEYRDAENANLMETLKTSPIIGYGYGKAILLDTPMVDLTDIDPLIHYMTHNQILWVWMRVGTIGFFCFWVMITSLIMQGCQILKNPNATPEAKAAALAGILIIVMQMVFGLLDLQISNVRNMLFCGLWAGAIGMFRLQYSEAADLEAEVLSSSGRISNAPRWKLPAPEQQQS
jgi:O-antigen ligase